MPKTVRPSTDEMNQLFIKANENHQNGLLDAAGSGYLRLLDYFPEAPLLHFNLGLVYYEQGEFEDSRGAFEKAADLSPEDMDILFNLGLCQKRTGDIEGAITSYIRIVETDPMSIDTLYNLAGCYKDSGQQEKAIEIYRQVLQLKPEHLAANNNLAFVYHVIGETSLACHYYQKVLEYQPDHQGAKHMLASLTGAAANSSPESYVRGVFDNYSSYYEHSLVIELEYCVPKTIRAVLNSGVNWKPRFEHGLDLGCGTGLGAQALADLVDALDGIDLSEKMIALAAAKNLYRQLYAENIVSYLATTKESYDFFLAADVFAYIGDLSEIFALIREHSQADVLFCFSTESIEGDSYRLQQTGRFAHSPTYIEKVAQSNRWQVITRKSTSLRKEKGVWVKGDLWFLMIESTS